MPDPRRHPATLLSTHATAEALGVQPRTMADWRRRGSGPPFIRLSATRVRYSVDALEAWLRARTDGSTAEPPAPSRLGAR